MYHKLKHEKVLFGERWGISISFGILILLNWIGHNLWTDDISFFFWFFMIDDKWTTLKGSITPLSLFILY